ncbi:uncharacterized protein LOC126889877 [Diabrotica virgifera virgifera]|uniref:Uncharacterized protein n=1 Tax=Diabrotica virgifera virgifera TaxID=50390 RepID=A0ABM5KWH5_DIAVI|nr:uncharacterized protein LOC126889877 [Diabrotica virgifera virgifera]
MDLRAFLCLALVVCTNASSVYEYSHSHHPKVTKSVVVQTYVHRPRPIPLATRAFAGIASQVLANYAESKVPTVGIPVGAKKIYPVEYASHSPHVVPYVTKSKSYYHSELPVSAYSSPILEKSFYGGSLGYDSHRGSLLSSHSYGGSLAHGGNHGSLLSSHSYGGSLEHGGHHYY